ncbi:LytTR family two component transcriptional regulator [Winogradskyella epiphytica]|uniref:LytTR family two component transcriptional regulator n=1 Tax=Winogradskyella epiphytica TaxID=262005 RepID=A0A2V4X0T7_9FLAO|nr:LytTR family DNA-binding domain-containing protein [Winogradskyella epiphytica]PYE83512.1 LytTR family two component transcriptional regulator [Winogradskyella epiphytica]GGW58702.1 DNA-binding response regulator [Winogradskyella epiphytica]
MLKAVILDDEPKAIQSLVWELGNFDQEIEVIASFTDPDKALTYLESHTPDCLFLDVQMPTIGGFQFLEQLNHINFAVVITTAYDEYAIKALKHEAIDYLLKPIDSDDLRTCIAKIKKHSERNINSLDLERMLTNFNAQFDKKRITINADGKLLFLDVDDIIYIESDGNYSTLYLQNRKKIVVTKKLKEVDAMLPEHYFFRIHNSYIINLNKIKAFIKNEGYVIMDSDHKIPVARQRKSDFLEKL